MGDDETKDRGENTRPLETDEVERIDFPDFPDREEFVRTMEMDGDSVGQMTRPMQPVLDKTTKRYDVPRSLMEMARTSQTISVEGEWAEFQAIVDQDGTVLLPDELRQRLSMTVVTLRVKIEEP